MRNPGRRDGDDARSDPTDPSTPQAGSARRSGGRRYRRCPHPTARADASGLTDDDLAELSATTDLRPRRTSRPDIADLADSADFDDLLFDPLLSDEPIDLAAVRADDALIDALGGGDLVGADDLVDPDDPLIAMLAAWAASARPETEAAPRSRTSPPLSARSRPTLRSCDPWPRHRSARPPTPDPRVPRTRCPEGGRPTSVQGPPTEAIRATPTPATLPTPRIWIRPPSGCCRPPGSARAPSRAPTPTPPTRPVRYSLAGAAAAAPAAAVPAASSVAGLLSRTRRLRRRFGRLDSRSRRGTRCAGRRSPSSSSRWGSAGPPPAGAPRCRAIPAWAISEVFFAKRAQSIKAAAGRVRGAGARPARAEAGAARRRRPRARRRQRVAAERGRGGRPQPARRPAADAPRPSWR